MGSKCTYFEVYDPEAGRWTRWGKKVQNKHQYSIGNIAEHKEIAERITGDPDRVAEAFRKRHGIPAYEESDAVQAKYARSNHFQFELLAMQVFLDKHEITSQCPYECYSEDVDCCIFHLSKERKDELDISPAEVQRAERARG